eukprot:CAMPEP_0173330378 /NCGR_PEP_ID=MMETSP1144-20121109/3217_1 /TAXON_ID=483371 /ORGANISM="non described non described, Strain CCMP2298" /LENGTH=151 /DNA_ID=CAMNT_0014275051 /DNA_START=283 /DNA_END=738 /DNA_ORIENTATION=-
MTPMLSPMLFDGADVGLAGQLRESLPVALLQGEGLDALSEQGVDLGLDHPRKRRRLGPDVVHARSQQLLRHLCGIGRAGDDNRGGHLALPPHQVHQLVSEQPVIDGQVLVHEDHVEAPSGCLQLGQSVLPADCLRHIPRGVRHLQSLHWLP